MRATGAIAAARGVSTLSVSALKSWRACQRLYRYQYVDRMVPVTQDENLVFGTLGHRGLEAWWLAARDYPDDSDAWLRAALAAIDAEDPFMAAKAEALMLGYHARWAGQRYRVLEVESGFELPLVNPETNATSRTWQLVGRTDVLVEDERGRRIVVEHKTSSEDISPGSDYWQRLRLDQQVSTYIEAAKADVCLYDVLVKPGQRPLKATPEELRKYTKPTKKDPEPRLYSNQRAEDETPEEYKARIVEHMDPEKHFARVEVVRLEEDQREAAIGVWQTGVQIRDAKRLKLFPQNPDACHRYGRRCEYLGVCLGEEALDDPYRFKPKEEAPNDRDSTDDDNEAAA